jgi:hypothetical protein
MGQFWSFISDHRVQRPPPGPSTVGLIRIQAEVLRPLDAAMLQGFCWPSWIWLSDYPYIPHPFLRGVVFRALCRSENGSRPEQRAVRRIC